MDYFLGFANLQANALRLGDQFATLGTDGVATLNESESLGRQFFLAQIQNGDLGFGSQGISLCLGEDPAATGHLFLVFLEPPLAFLAGILELPHASLQVAQPLLAFGQFHFCFGGLAAFDLPLRFELFGPRGQLLQPGFHLGQQSLCFVLLGFGGV